MKSLTALKFVYIDAEIVPIVKWLNRFKSVTTMFSDKGLPKTDTLSARCGFIIFSCYDHKDLQDLFYPLRHLVEIKLTHLKNMNIYYTMSWKYHNLDAILEIITGIKNE